MAKRKHVVESDSEEEFKINKFVDVEASEDETSSNESMDDFINEIAEDVEVAEEVAGKEEMAKGKEEQEEYASSSSEQLEDFEEYTKTVEERYKSADAIEVEEIPQQLLLPTDKSPKLWLIRCTPGKEKQMVLSVIRKAIFNKLNIIGVLANEQVKGYIYIEAYQKQQVMVAIDGIAGIFKTNVMQVPNKEMTDVLFIPELDTVLFKKGNYLRILKGRYAGEIGRVNSIRATKGLIFMKIVPKVDGKYKLFSPKDYKDSEVYKMPDGKWIHKKNMYKDGYLLKEIPVGYLSAFPTIAREEKNWFDTAENKKTAGAHFVKDEVVEVVYGGLKGAVGKILTVGEEEVLIKIGDLKVSVSLAEIKKRYSVGDEVQVISGRKRGKRGFVVGISDNTLTISISNFTEEIEAGLDEVKLSSVPDSEQEREKAQSKTKIAYRPKRDPLVDRKGEITAGEYKGKRGTIKDVLENTYRIQLITTLKCVSVEKTDFLIHGRNALPPMGTETTPKQLLELISQEKEETENESDESTTVVQNADVTPEIKHEHMLYKPESYNPYNISDDR